MEQGKITIHAVSTQDQIADLLTKPLAEREYTRMKYKSMGEIDRRRCPHLPGNVRKYEEQDRTNDKCWVSAMLQEKDMHKMKEKQ